MAEDKLIQNGHHGGETVAILLSTPLWPWLWQQG